MNSNSLVTNTKGKEFYKFPGKELEHSCLRSFSELEESTDKQLRIIKKTGHFYHGEINKTNSGVKMNEMKK